MSGCLGLGLWYREQFVGRTRAMRSLAMILEMLMSEIRYGKSTLPECCKQLSERIAEPYGSCFGRIWRKMQDGESSFQEAFCENMRDCLRDQPLLEEDREIFLQAFAEKGFQDGSMQLRSIEQGMERLTRRISETEGEQKEKCRMAVGLGAMSGLLLLIILL